MFRLLIFEVDCHYISTRLSAQYACGRHANKGGTSKKMQRQHTDNGKRYNRKYIQLGARRYEAGAAIT